MNIIQTNHRPIAYKFLLLLLLLVFLCCCYLSCSVVVTCLALLLLLLLLSLATIATCYCCHYCCSLSLLLLVTQLLPATLLVHLPLTGIDNFRQRSNECAIDTIVRNSLPSTDRFWHRCYHTTLLLLLCLQILIFQVWLNLTNSAANTWVYSFTSRRVNQQIWVEYSTLENYCEPTRWWAINNILPVSLSGSAISILLVPLQEKVSCYKHSSS